MSFVAAQGAMNPDRGTRMPEPPKPFLRYTTVGMRKAARAKMVVVTTHPAATGGKSAGGTLPEAGRRLPPTIPTNACIRKRKQTKLQPNTSPFVPSDEFSAIPPLVPEV